MSGWSNIPRAVSWLAFSLSAFTTAGAQAPLFTLVDPVPAAAQTWSAAEEARSPMVAQSRFVRVDTTALGAMPLGGAPPLGTFAADLFDERVDIEFTSRKWALGYRVFDGHVVGRQSEVHVVLAPGGETWASIDVEARQFVIAYTGVGDVHVLQRIDQRRLPAHMGCGTDHTTAVVAPPAQLSSSGSPNTNCSLTTIDVIVFYTPLARQNAGGVAAIEAAIVGAIAQANDGHMQSGVPAEFRLVHMAETNYAELGTGTDLANLRSDQDGFMDEVHALRDTYGADLVHLVTDPASPAYCGIAYLMTNLSTGFASSAFGVTVRTCISNRSFTHECGHNMGCHHDAANAGSALFPYSYGFRTADDAYRTIMAYPPGVRINRWSSPNVTWLGYTMGVAGAADNVLTLNQTVDTVAQFHATTAPNWCQLGGGITGALGKPLQHGSGTMNLVDPIELTIGNYAPNSIGLVAIGASALSIPAFGGTVEPSPDILLAVLGSGPDIVQNLDWMATLPPAFRVWLQTFFLDATAVEGLSATDALTVTIP